MWIRRRVAAHVSAILDLRCGGSKHRMAHDTGLSRSFIDKLLTMESAASIETLAKIAEAYKGIGVRDLLAPIDGSQDDNL